MSSDATGVDSGAPELLGQVAGTDHVADADDDELAPAAFEEGPDAVETPTC